MSLVFAAVGFAVVSRRRASRMQLCLYNSGINAKEGDYLLRSTSSFLLYEGAVSVPFLQQSIIIGSAEIKHILVRGGCLCRSPFDDDKNCHGDDNANNKDGTNN